MILRDRNLRIERQMGMGQGSTIRKQMNREARNQNKRWQRRPGTRTHKSYVSNGTERKWPIKGKGPKDKRGEYTCLLTKAERVGETNNRSIETKGRQASARCKQSTRCKQSARCKQSLGKYKSGRRGTPEFPRCPFDRKERNEELEPQSMTRWLIQGNKLLVNSLTNEIVMSRDQTVTVSQTTELPRRNPERSLWTWIDRNGSPCLENRKGPTLDSQAFLDNWCKHS